MSPTWVMIQRKALHLLASTHLGLLSSVISRPMALMRQSLQRTWTSSRVSSVAPRTVNLLTEDQRRRNRRHQHVDELRMHSRTQLHQRPRRLPLYILCPRPVVHLPRVLPLLPQTRPLMSLLRCHCALHLRLPARRWPRCLQLHHPHHLHALSQSHHLRHHRRHLRPPSAVQLYLHRLHFRQEKQGLPPHRRRRLLPQRTVLALRPHHPRHLRVVEHLRLHLHLHPLHLRAEHHLHHHPHLHPGVVDR
jgi:hypothetical protein